MIANNLLFLSVQQIMSQVLECHGYCSNECRVEIDLGLPQQNGKAPSTSFLITTLAIFFRQYTNTFAILLRQSKIYLNSILTVVDKAVFSDLTHIDHLACLVLIFEITIAPVEMISRIEIESPFQSTEYYQLQGKI